ncbi:rab-GTPase-TBC domain-containing protein [Halteromyces radiatus]|uniref:rab-GTPase-TBC domain-containing protein n=1 Tax=Halteromyces radiatus TaxID=101107 RepID=UPI0022201BA9|nr:rab-GTPase-TBC domain-containing protein [Halteromyces radiatus]KAI8082999.1 rab-GTPase-TBC domain-containing protein [Halteromyces radiatus]
MKEFREVCFRGIPEESGLHATAWKVLLGYLPPEKSMWQSTIYEQRLSYYNLVKDLLEKPGEEPPSSDHPLNSTPGSKWATYIQDNNTLEQIDKDVRRTLPDFAFFQQRVPQNPLNPLSSPPLPVNNTIEESNDIDPLQQSDTKRRFSFGIMGRPRSGSNTSKKSLKVNNSLNNANRSRSNSKSSTRSSGGIMMENGTDMIHSPRNIVRKLSTAFSKSSSSLSLTNNTTTTKYNKKQSSTAALTPICPYIPNRRSLFKRIQQQQTENSQQEKEKEDGYKKEGDDDYTQDYHWEVIERILFMYAKLNPGIGYVQGMNEILAPIYYVFANDTSPGLAGQVHAEPDTFYVFTILMGDVRDHFVRSLDQDGMGIHATLFRMQQRLAWYDKTLWRDLQKKEVKEPYYAFRWITVLFTQEWDLPDVIRLWDSLLAERGMSYGTKPGGERYQQTDTSFEFLLDFAVAMLVCIRQDLLKGDFAENIKLLQNYPVNDIQFVLTMANRIRETRLQMVSMGQVVPGVNDIRHSGVFSGDWSDTSSISSTTSTASSRLQQRLRESTDIARASFDSFKRESKESMDDIFRRGMAASGEQWKRASTGEMKRSISQRLGFVKSNVFNKAKRSGSVRSTTSETSFISSQQQQKHWLLANQFNQSGILSTSSSTSDHHHHFRSNSANSNNNSFIPYTSDRQRTISGSSQTYTDDGSISSRSSNMLNRFSQLMVSGHSASSITPYQRSSSPHVYDPLTTNGNDVDSLVSTTNPTSHDDEDDNEKLLFAKAAAARDEALYYRTSTAGTYKGCV